MFSSFSPHLSFLFYSHLLSHLTFLQYVATVAENKADTLVVKISVTDGDEPHSPAWNAKFTIVDGDPGGLFTVETGTNKQDGLISTAKVGSKARILKQDPTSK